MIYLIIIAIATSAVAILHLIQLIPVSRKTRRKRYLVRLTRNIEAGQEGIWAMDLRVSTLKTLREGVRRQLDQTSNRVKMIEDELQKKSDENKDLASIISAVGGVIPVFQPGMTPLEFRQEGTAQRKKKWIEMVQELKEKAHGEDRKKMELEASVKERKEIFTLLDTKVQSEMDAQQMTEQMFGKYSPRENKKLGGIDQEIEQVEQKIQSGLAFMIEIKNEMKRV